MTANSIVIRTDRTAARIIEPDIPAGPRANELSRASLLLEFHIRLVGEFDIAGAPSITSTLSYLADVERPDGAARLVIDLSRVSFMDSRGLTALAECRELLLASGWEVVLDRAPRHLYRLLQHAVDAGWLASDSLTQARYA